MELQVYNADKNLPAIGEESQDVSWLPFHLRPNLEECMMELTIVGFDEQLQELIRRGLDFDTWTSIISKIEKTYPPKDWDEKLEGYDDIPKEVLDPDVKKPSM